MLAITGFLPGDDPRMKATVDAIAARLTDERGLVYRYLAHDGLAGAEGTFLLCTFWLAHAQALAGELDQATATFERAVAAINEVGLLAEEVDPGSGEMIGNFPQAFSHIGLVNAAWAIAQARELAAGRGQMPAPGSGTTQEHGSRPDGSWPVGALYNLWRERLVPGTDDPAGPAPDATSPTRTVTPLSVRDNSEPDPGAAR
jgi:hypothetical protein